MITVQMLITSTILVMVESSPVRRDIIAVPKSPTTQKPEEVLKRLRRNFRDVEFEIIPNHELWTEDTLDLVFPPRALSVINFQSGGYHTPVFSDGLEYPDTFLLTGPQAKRKTNHLYSKELFFGDIPHLKILLRNQYERKYNGLSENRLGSIRINSPLDISNRPKQRVHAYK
ncbi:hypothetical protein JTB14_008250 [Gonioctena quinquepunctata]|nr:hypothetical protein JTB14_008250 [Gonioctena quinquepunctata]